jgi:hypothetical protein
LVSLVFKFSYGPPSPAHIHFIPSPLLSGYNAEVDFEARFAVFDDVPDRGHDGAILVSVWRHFQTP